jgi:hypothetical protein
MAERLEVVFVDDGWQDPGPGSPRGGSGGGSLPSPGGGRTPGPADRATGPEKEKDSSGAFVRAGEVLAAALGAGGLFRVVKSLAESFYDLWKAVNASTAAHEANAKSVGSSGGGGSYPKPGDDENVIDAEFELKPGPGRGLIPAPSAVGRNFSTGVNIQTVGVTSAAGPSAAAASGATAGSLSSLAAAAGPAAIAVAALSAAVVAGAVVVRRTINMLEQEADRLSAYSGEVAGATAMSDIRAELADIRRAERIGPNLARFEDLRGQAMEKLADIGTEVLDQVLRLVVMLEPAIRAGIASGNVVAASVPVMSDALLSILAAQAGNAAALGLTNEELANLKRLNKEILNFARLEWEDRNTGDDPFLAEFLDEFGLGEAKKPMRRRAPGIAAGAPRGLIAGGGGFGA